VRHTRNSGMRILNVVGRRPRFVVIAPEYGFEEGAAGSRARVLGVDGTGEGARWEARWIDERGDCAWLWCGVMEGV
jgi:hypothetical protein